MRAVVAPEPGGPEALQLVDRPALRPGPGEVVITTVATAVNRADLLQRMGFYPPPPGASDVLGLECSGRIAAVGEGVELKVGAEVCALLTAGGYAEQVLVPAGQVMQLPPGVDLATAAAVPEVAATVWSNVVMIAGLKAGDRFLVHGGAGGIGTFAIQLAKALGATVFATAGSAEKLDLCRSLGADEVINYRDDDFVEVLTRVGGADIILDIIAGDYVERNFKAARHDARIVQIAFNKGSKMEINLMPVMLKRLTYTGSTLRSRPDAFKTAIAAELQEKVWPLFPKKLVTVTHSVLPMSQAAEAHAMMEAASHRGKILLKV